MHEPFRLTQAERDLRQRIKSQFKIEWFQSHFTPLKPCFGCSNWQNQLYRNYRDTLRRLFIAQILIQSYNVLREVRAQKIDFRSRWRHPSGANWCSQMLDTFVHTFTLVWWWIILITWRKSSRNFENDFVQNFLKSWCPVAEMACWSIFFECSPS